MSISVAQSLTAVGPNITSSFLASGGTAPYTYSVQGGGAGGSIDASTGIYTAPATVPTNPAQQFDTIIATDSLSATGTAQILVGDPLLLFCDILASELGLDPARVFLWDQKIFQPTDSGLYIAVSVPSCKPFSNNLKPALNGSGNPDWSAGGLQETNFMATLDINAISRDNTALRRKEEILLALNSLYAQSQQEANSFYIGKLPPNARFQNLSMVDGAAIPYRYLISVNMQYAATKSKAVPYFSTFQNVQVNTNP
jgi:hypothetical protein